MTTPNLTTIIIIGYNTRSYLKTCLDSVYCQTTRDIEIIYIDNNSEDNSTEFIVEHYPKVKIVQNNSNTGYAKAANQGIELSQGDYVMILNPDVILEPDYTINSITALIKNPKAAAVCGKNYKYDFDQGKKTNIIDTVGLVAFRSRRFLDNGSGLIDNNQFEKPTEVFGVSGNCAIFRKTALEDAKMGGEYFDHDFYMYKEDVDMCWRLRLFGWTFIYTPDAIAHHKRGTGVKNRLTLKATIEGRVEMDDFQRFDSFKTVSYTHLTLPTKRIV